MAIDQTQVLPAPVLEAALTAFTQKLPPLMGQQINTAAYNPQVAAQTALQTGASQAAGGLGSLVGPDAYQQFMSPYQQQVMDTTLSEFDRQQTIGQQGLRDQAIQAGAYGGGREGVMQAQYMNQGGMDRAALQAQLLNQGFMQAQQAAGTDLAARQGLGTYQQALGQADQGFAQAQLDAGTMAAREAEFEPFTRLGLVGQQLAQIQPGAFPSTTIGYQQSAAPASPMASFLGGAAGAGGVLGKLGIFG
tara:strand:+ start:127 stop:870 length:744 start_codon:yes stop_codon:yes gene_type:complete